MFGISLPSICASKNNKTPRGLETRAVVSFLVAMLGMTQKELGEALSVHWNSVARMERDEFPIIRTTDLAVKYLLVMQSKKGGKEK